MEHKFIAVTWKQLKMVLFSEWDSILLTLRDHTYLNSKNIRDEVTQSVCYSEKLQWLQKDSSNTSCCYGDLAVKV